MTQKRSYYAIIPANVRYDDKLTANAKLLYGEITALCNQEGYCWAGNDYFANLYGVSTVSISKWINQLVEEGYVSSTIKHKKGDVKTTKRYLRIVNDPHKEKLTGSLTKVNDPHKEKFKHNNTVNNTNNNTMSTKRDIPYKEIIEYLNEKTGKKISYRSNGNKKLIHARINEGYTVEDFKKVIDNKVNDWFGKGIKFSNGKPAENYLHPSTLFIPKNFDKYLNEALAKQPNVTNVKPNTDWKEARYK